MYEWWTGRSNVARRVCQFHLSGGSSHSYFTVSSLSVVRKMVSFKLIVPVCARTHHVNTISGISSCRVATSRLVSKKNANFKDAARIQRTQVLVIASEGISCRLLLSTLRSAAAASS